MKKIIICFIIVFSCLIPAHAMDITAPEVPESGRIYLNDEPETFSQGLLKILNEALHALQPAILDAGKICAYLIVAVILLSMAQSIQSGNHRIIQLIGSVVISVGLFSGSRSLIQLGESTVNEISNYGKLLLPALASALAAQGGVTASAALYTGTAFFNSLLSGLISSLIIPLLYAFLVLSVGNNAIGEGALEKLKELVKSFMIWLLKTMLYVYTGYLGITGVVSGSVDAAAMKATKLTISGIVPVVGGILSDASETVLVSARIIKNSVGVYGLLAVIAIWIGPFLKIGAQYLLLKLTWAVCGMFGAKENVKLIGDFSGAMGLLLGMTGTVCLLFLVSTICLMRCAGV